jgi:ferredoxin-type protein NapF
MDLLAARQPENTVNTIAQIDHSKRAFFRRPSSLKASALNAGVAKGEVSDVLNNEFNNRGLLPQRPPWALEESLFTDECTRCNECISACAEEIIIIGDGGFPEIDFKRGECTFCEDCVDACAKQSSNGQPALMKQEGKQPFYFNITIDDSCLAKQKIHCQSCKDACDTRAITMPWPKNVSLGAIQTPEINIEDCTSCGACISICPSQSISINPIASPELNYENQ